MRAGVDNKPKDFEKARARYRSAIATAVVAATFSAVFFVLVVANYVQVSVVAPRREAELAALKVKIRSQTDDRQLLSRIRALDLQMRRQKIRRLVFSRKCDYLLLGSVVVALTSLTWAGSYRRKLPAPGPIGNERVEQLRQAGRSRWAVTTGLAALVAAGVVLSMWPRTDFAGAEATGPSYPSWDEIARNWHRFRGPSGAGVSACTNIPTSWDGKSGQGILWKTEIPLPGHNSPVVWGDRVFLSGATDKRREVYCFGAISGRLLWTGEVPTTLQAGKKLEIGQDTGFAASTVATDGRRVYAIFATGDVGCFDFDGKRVWARSLGIPDSAYGYTCSLEVYRNVLFVQYDQAGVEDQKSRLLALDGFSGRSLWEAKRPVANSWTSPILIKVGDKYQLITLGDPWVISYDPGSGTEIWRAKCVSGDLVPSAIYAGGLVFVVEPYTQVVAVRPDGRGDVTGTHIAWRAEDGGPDICSPVGNGELVFVVTTEGTLKCYKAADGSKVYEKELDTGFRASPSLVGDKLYLLDEKGVMYIAEAGPQYKELARCRLGEDCWASPAFADGRIYLRGIKNLYSIGNKP